MKIKKRMRGTAIVDTRKGILVVAGRSKKFITPGGGTNKHETRTKAAIRELREETGLRTIKSIFLFRCVGKVHRSHGGGKFQDYHTVVLLKTKGRARPRHEVKYIDYYKPNSNVNISYTTKQIIEKYYDWKLKNSLMYKIKRLFLKNV